MSAPINPLIDPSWLAALQGEFDAKYMADLKSFLIEERKNHVVLPTGSLIFNAFNLTPLPTVKVVILGQDPYHGVGQAHGLCFSVRKGMDIPPSLRNIYKELHSDVGIEKPKHGNLENWAHQGVLLLNATLTVRIASPGSHQGRGWERFTDQVIRSVSEHRNAVIFLLWGNSAIEKSKLIDRNKHHILTASHPSPLSASRGFFGCKHFSKTNQLLIDAGKSPIDWQII